MLTTGTPNMLDRSCKRVLLEDAPPVAKILEIPGGERDMGEPDVPVPI